MIDRLERAFTPLTFLVALIGWSSAAWFLRPEESGELVILPDPWRVASDLAVLFTEDDFTTDIVLSLSRICLGLLIAVVPAVCLGILFGMKARLNRATAPLFAFAKYVPPVAFIPILILWLGVGIVQQMALLFIGTFFYLTVMITTTVTNTPPTFGDAAATLGVSRWQYITRVVIPYGVPEFIEHLRTVVGIAWTYLVVVEMVAAESGIGRVIINAQRYLQTGRVLAGVFTIGLLGILSDQFLQLVGWWLAPWKFEEPPLLVRGFTRVKRMVRSSP